jgi:hypothetical protein
MPMEHGVGENNVESTDNDSDEIITAAAAANEVEGKVDLTSDALVDINQYRFNKRF